MALDYRHLSQGELVRLLELRDRRQRNQAPARSRIDEAERYRSLMEQAEDGIFIADNHGFFLEVNLSGARMLGRSPKEIVGRHARDFVVPEDISALEADLAGLRRRKVYRNERRLRRKDGSILQVEVSVKKLSDGRIQGILRDITLRKQAEESLRQSEERFRSFTAAAFEGICLSENGRILDVNDLFAAMFGYEHDELIGREILTLIEPKWRPVIAERIRTGQEVLLEHQLLRKDGSVFEAEAQSKVVSWRGRTVRVTALRDVTDRKRAEQALRESEEKFSKAFRASPDGLAISELETGRYIEVNEGYGRLYGYRREEMLGHTSFELGIWDNPKDRVQLVAGLETAGNVRDLEMRTRTRDGSLRIILLSAESIELAGKLCLVSVLHDVTDRIQVEQALRESEEKYAKAFRNSPDAVTITCLTDGRIIEANEGFRRIFGHPPDAVVGRTTLELQLWGNPADRDNILRELQQTGFVREWELPFRKRDGKTGVGLISAEKIEIHGIPCLVTVVRDVTERKQAEAALRASEESLRATVEYTPYVGVQWFDRRGRVIFWNQASETIYGWTAAEAMGKTLDQLILAPAEQAFFEKALIQIEKSGKPVGPMEFLFHHRNGSPGFVLSTIFRIPASNDEPRFVCMDVDITERKRAEAERERAVAGEQSARAEYTLQLIESQEAERKRIAAELHDSLGQDLLLIKNRAQLALAPAARPSELREQLEGISQLASQSIAEARRISYDLHPHQLQHLGLTRALEAMMDSTTASSGIVFQHKLDNVDGLFLKDAAMNLYRIVQESLSNIIKHSRARQAHIRLERDVHEVQLHIQDNGCGYKTGEPVRGGKGLGLKNIAERVRILGGKLKIDSRPGQGTRLEVTIPIADGE
ncbi:MAG: PAS domain S-box protein [Limisphaerales bacterium]